MNTAIYKIQAITNMHVGSGNANYGIIDNLVQRDPVNSLPTINGSSLKGALREFFENQWGKNDAKIVSIFGNDENNSGYRFLSANLLAIPMRSNKKAYFLATAPMVIERLKENAEDFNFSINLENFDNLEPKDGKPIIFCEKENELLIEDFEAKNIEQIKRTFNCPVFGGSDKLVYLSDNDYIELCDDTSLPVVARNRVGENKNLWYEQIVPHKSIFSFVILHNKEYFENFDKGFKNELIHIGANATVGQGFTKITQLS